MPNLPSIASMSLGRARHHLLPEKLTQASKAGFKGIEIFYECLETLAKERNSGVVDVDEESLLSAAKEVRTTCDDLGLKIVCLQPFMFYEGLTDRRAHEARIAKLKTWFRIVKVLGTDVVQIPSNFGDGVSLDMELVVGDMLEVAELGLREDPVVRFAYENLAWGTFVDTWEVMWEVVRRVDRSNFGCCLDTFNIAGRVWADPSVESGMTEFAEADLKKSLERLVATVDVEKVFFVQVVDAERMERPLVEGHPFYVDGQPARMSWSRNARLFLYEQDRGGYLPVVEVARVLLKELKFEGWVSMELFSRTMSDPDPSVPFNHAQRGIESWKKLVEDLSL